MNKMVVTTVKMFVCGLALGGLGCGAQSPSFKENNMSRSAKLQTSGDAEARGDRNSSDASTSSNTDQSSATGSSGNDSGMGNQSGDGHDGSGGEGHTGGSGDSNTGGGNTGGGDTGSGNTGGNTGSGNTGGNTGGGNTGGGNTGGGNTGGGDTGGGNNGGPTVVTPSCASETSLAKAGKTVDLNWAPVSLANGATVSVRAKDASYSGNVGSASILSSSSARYTAPASLSNEISVEVVAKKDNTVLGVCAVRVIPDGGIGVGDDGMTRGLIGSIYKLPNTTKILPNFSAMNSIGDIVSDNLDVPNRRFETGFPGVDAELIEWFGIRFEGTLTVQQAGKYWFKLTSDDGANLYIDGVKVVNNDGEHAVESKENSVTLSAGKHSIRVDYYQGPRYYIALQLFWKASSGADYAIVPSSVLSRPAN